MHLQIPYETSQKHDKEEDCYAVHFKTIKIPLTVVPSPHSFEISKLDDNSDVTRKHASDASRLVLFWICIASSTKRPYLKIN